MIQPEALKKRERLLWSTGSGVDVWDLFGACLAGDLPTVKRLVDNDPSLVRSQHAYKTPVSFAVRENRIDVVAFLLERGADPFGLAVNDSLLEICRDRGYGELAHLLEATFADTRNASPRGEAVAAAIREHDLRKLRSLLDASPGLLHAGDERSNQPIHWAVMTRQIEVIDELLGRGADIDAARFDEARPIQLTNGDYHFRGWRDVPPDWPTTPAQVLAHLRARGAYCDICTACHIGDLHRVRELLDRDPSLANRVSEYVTYSLGSGAPLRNAAANGHLAIVELLLSRGADPNLPEEGIAPHGHALYSAAANRHFEIARVLLEHGAFPNPEVESSADALSRAISNSDQPMTPLHHLARKGDLDRAAQFIDHGADLDARDEDLCSTPLGWAAKYGQWTMVELLLRRGAEPSLPDDPPWATPLAWATRRGHREIAERLAQRSD